MASFHYEGKLYRALNPIYAREPLLGRGAELYGGRFNPKGVPALYCSLSAMTALREANQVGSLQPTTLVSYDAEIREVFDARDATALASEDMTAAELADTTWRDQMKTSGEAKTQAFKVFQQGLSYCWSVVVAAAPAEGKRLMEKWLACDDRIIHKVMQENLKKNRLVRMDAAWVERWRE